MHTSNQTQLTPARRERPLRADERKRRGRFEPPKPGRRADINDVLRARRADRQRI